MFAFEGTVIIFLIGMAAGTIGSIIGIGGGIVIAPVLTLVGFTPSQIASTSLIAVTSTSVSSVIEYTRQKRIKYKIGLKMACFSVPGAVIGAFISSEISPSVFRAYFALLLAVASIYIYYKNSVVSKKKNKKIRPIILYLIFYSGAASAGIVSSLFGIGGGIVFVPMLVILFEMGMAYAAPTSQLTLLITSISGVISHLIISLPDYNFAVVLAIGSFVGGQIGARFSTRLQENVLNKLLSLSLIIVAIKFVFDYLYHEFP